MENTDILREAMAFHEIHPGLRSKTAWIEGRRACLAGRIVLVAGAEPLTGGIRPETGRLVSYQGRRYEVPELACRLAGLIPSEARWLFHWSRSTDEQRLAVNAVLDERGMPARPYWVYPDTPHRWISPGGIIQAAHIRRTVYLMEGVHWQAYDCATPLTAYEWAGKQARAMGAIIYYTPLQEHIRKVNP